jgi:hypothetical protein
VAGCSWVPSEFQRTAHDAISTFSSASLTLQYEHPDPLTGETRLTREYASAAFISYAEAVAGMVESMPTSKGAPDAETLAPLLEVVGAAVAVINDPCLDPTCAWSAQVEQLEAAKSALEKAAP